MASYYFDEDINAQSVKKFIEFANNHESLDIYFSTNGGDLDAAEIMIDYLNKRDNDTLIASFVLLSCGFLIWMMTKTKKVYLDGFVYGLIHSGNGTLYTRELRQKNHTFSSINKDGLDRYDNKILKMLNKKLSKAEIKAYKEGEDICFDLDRMRSMFPE